MERAWLLLGTCHCAAAWGFGRRRRNGTSWLMLLEPIEAQSLGILLLSMLQI
jgi:hypothetical protein